MRRTRPRGTTAAAATGAAENIALVNGVRVAFTVGGILGLVAIVCAPFVSRVKQNQNS